MHKGLIGRYVQSYNTRIPVKVIISKLSVGNLNHHLVIPAQLMRPGIGRVIPAQCIGNFV